MLIETIKHALGYCNECGRPTVVGHYRLAGWKHTFTLCTMCLRSLAQAIDAQSDKLYKEGDLK